MIVALLLALFACVIHESGHILAAYFVGIPIKKIGLDWRGLYTVRPMAPEMWKNVTVTAAGPLANILAAALLYRNGNLDLAWANLFIGLFNIIPFYQSDGWRLIKYLEAPQEV